MKKVLFILLSLMVVGSMAFGQVAFSGSVKYATLFWPENTTEQLNIFEDIQLSAAWTADKYTKGVINLRAKLFDNGPALVALTSAPKGSPAMVDKAMFETNLAGYFDLTGITLKLSGGFMDLNTGKIATINNFQLSRIEYNLGKGNTLRLDVGVPMATLYFATDLTATKNYSFNADGDFYNTILGLTGSIMGVQYEAAWAKPGVAYAVGNVMVQAKYGLRLPEKMLLVLAGGVDMDLDGAASSMDNNLSNAGDAFAVKYVAAARFSLPKDFLGVGVDFGVDFNGSNEKSGTTTPWLANALGFDLNVNVMGMFNVYGGMVFELNQVTAKEGGLAYWYALIGKAIGKMDIRVGYAYRGAENDMDGSGKDFRLSTADNNDNWCNLNKLSVNTGALYLGLLCKF